MFAQTSNALGLLSVDKPYSSPNLSSGQGLASPLVPCAPLSASLQAGLDGLDLSPRVGSSGASCSILPSSFCMWTQNEEKKHVFTNLVREKSEQELPHKSLESVRASNARFPRLAEMHRRMPCQFLHINVPLSLPHDAASTSTAEEFKTWLTLSSIHDTQLASVTTLYLDGKRVSCVVEPMSPPRKMTSTSACPTTPPSDKDSRRVSSGSNVSFSSASNSSLGPESPRTPPEANTTAKNQHQWHHQAPFKTAFFAEFLRLDRPSSDESPSESQRDILDAAVSSLTLVQEFVVPVEGSLKDNTSYSISEECAAELSSPGSTIGDVVLVVAWDFECDDSSNEPRSPTVSLLTAANGTTPSNCITPLPSPLLKFDLKPVQVNFSAAPSTVSQPTLLRKRGMSMNKANLMLNIPPPTMYLNAQNQPNSAMISSQLTPATSPGPIAWGVMHERASRTPLTPLPQHGGQLPDLPPPLNSGDEARLQKERLERLWASQAGDTDLGPLHSPLAMTFGANATSMPTSAASMNAATQARPSPNALGLTVPRSGFGLDGNLLSPAHF